MGLSKSIIATLIQEHKRSPFHSPALLLGKQHVYATMREVRSLMREHHLDPHPLPSGIQELTDMPDWAYGQQSRFISDRALLWTIAGIDMKALDCSAYEHADYAHDLNLPLPEMWSGRFGLVIDGGTCEHVFNVKNSFHCVAELAQPNGGQVIHITQASNWLDHGFFQFSPTVFYDRSEERRVGKECRSRWS